MVFPEIDPVAIYFGPISIRWYSLSYIFGILICWYIINKFLLKYKNQLSKKSINEVINFLILGMIIGGRLGYIIFYNFEFYLQFPVEIFKIWNGGMSFHGALVGIIFSIILYCRKNNYSFLDITDLISLVSPIGIFFGRIANFVNGELFGRITDSKIGIIFPNGGNLPRHPSQLYEALFEGLILYLILNSLFFFSKLKYIRGSISGAFLFFYGFFRFFIEYYREPDSQLGFILMEITMGQILCVIMMFVGLITIKYSFDQNKNEQ